MINGKAKLKLLESITKAKSHYDFKFTWLRPFVPKNDGKEKHSIPL